MTTFDSTMRLDSIVEDLPRYKYIPIGINPFPAATDEQKQTIREFGERLDVHRKRVQEAHEDITLPGLYDALEKVRAEEPITDKERDVYDRGLVGILHETGLRGLRGLKLRAHVADDPALFFGDALVV